MKRRNLIPRGKRTTSMKRYKYITIQLCRRIVRVERKEGGLRLLTRVLSFHRPSGLLKEELTLFLSKEATPDLRKEGLYLSSYPF